MPTPRISVIIPIYGTEKYLEKCLHSVREQTFKDIEIICVDDCSPDNSYKIVEKHIKKDKRIVLIRHKENLGLGGARNTAIRAAKADYLASVDSDDYMSPKMLEQLWKASDKGRADIVCCGFNRVDENDNILSYEEFTEASINNTKNKIDIFSTLNPAFWNKLWRKSLFTDNHIYFPNHDYFEDMSTTPRILAKARKIKVIKGRYYQYLIRTASITGRSSEKHLIDYFKGFEILMKFLEENKLEKRYEKELNRYIKGNILFYAKSILGAEDFVDNKKQYLRYLMLFRISFNENFQQFKKYDLGDSIAALGQEDLHGEYFHKHEKALKEIENKEDYIARQLDEIKRKQKELEVRSKSIAELRADISDITKKRNKTNDELKSSVNKFNNSQKVVAAKENYISKQLIDIEGKSKLTQEYAKTIKTLRKESSDNKKNISDTQNKLKKSNKTIEVKEDYISRQLVDIDKKKQLIADYASKINTLHQELSNAKKDIRVTKNALKKSDNTIGVKEDYISRQLVDIDKKKQLITDYATRIKALNQELSNSKKERTSINNKLTDTYVELSKIKNELSDTKDERLHENDRAKSIEADNQMQISKLEDTVSLLEDKLSQEVSFPQMLSIVAFATITKPTMNKKQTLKLMNKPKLFFQDSKSKFAKKYASWFNII